MLDIYLQIYLVFFFGSIPACLQASAVLLNNGWSFHSQFTIPLVYIKLRYTCKDWTLTHLKGPLHTWKKFCQKPILQNYLKIWIFSSIFRPPKKFTVWGKIFFFFFLISPLFMKIKIPSVFKFGTCELVDQIDTHCNTDT